MTEDGAVVAAGYEIAVSAHAAFDLRVGRTLWLTFEGEQAYWVGPGLTEARLHLGLEISL